MRLLIDTHILIWIVLGDRRLSSAQNAALRDPENAIVINPVVAYELTHLQQTGRIPLTETIEALQDLVGFERTDLPFDIWQRVKALPDIHRDPIDRMLVAHALCEGMILVSADKAIRRYPVETLG